ncbi:guanylate kinase [bacterium]|nr:guanylate kinase [bacterium]
MYRLKDGLLVILSSPSGGGKTSVYRELLKLNPEFAYSISVTTRPPRPGECNGREYHFKSNPEFEELKDAGAFVEWAMVHNYYYGTLRSPISEFLNKNKVVLLDIDIQGTLNIKKQYKEAVSIFILPPTFNKLTKRLISRKTDSKDVLRTRIKNAISEVPHWKKYDYLVINDRLGDCVKVVEDIIQAEKHKTTRYQDFTWDIPENILNEIK